MGQFASLSVAGPGVGIIRALMDMALVALGALFAIA